MDKLIYCSTVEESERLKEYLHNRGYRWFSGENLLRFDYFDYRYDSTYCLDGYDVTYTRGEYTDNPYNLPVTPCDQYLALCIPFSPVEPIEYTHVYFGVDTDVVGIQECRLLGERGRGFNQPVEFKKGFGGHTCGNLCENGYGWNVNDKDCLIPISEIRDPETGGDLEHTGYKIGDYPCTINMDTDYITSNKVYIKINNKSLLVPIESVSIDKAVVKR